MTEVTQTVADELYRAGTYLEANALHVNRRVYFLGDMQRSTLVDSVRNVMPGRIPVTLLPVTGGASENLAIGEATVASRIVKYGQPVKMNVVVRNYGKYEVHDRMLSLYLGTRRVAQASVTIPPDGSAQVEMAMTPREYGWIAGSVRLEDDAFRPDNKRYFTVFVPQTRGVLVVRGLSATPQFVRAALSSRLERGAVPAEFEIVDGTLPPVTVLVRYDVVVLLGKPAFTSGERDTLLRYVEAGGGLLVFPAEAVELKDYSALFGVFGGGSMAGLISAEKGASLTVEFDDMSLDHPVFEGMFTDADRRVERR